MSSPSILRGITWNHPRGFAPLVATAVRFQELHPEVAIRWEQHPLKAFEDFPVEKLADDFDLIVLDHPCIPDAAAKAVLLPLEEHLPAPFLDDQQAHSVGGSHRSYRFGSHQWALAIDAATPTASWREDLLTHHGFAPPRTWSDLLALARRGLVDVPSVPINCLLNFYTFCIAAGAEPFTTSEWVAPRATALTALDLMRELLALCDPGAWNRNPIATHELMASAENRRMAYCPLAYCYSNYARPGFAARRLEFGEPPTFGGAPLRTTLGGAGLAVSIRSRHRTAALRYAGFVASPEVQRTLYTQGGGQPGHRLAWLDADNNQSTSGYFRRILPVLDRAYVRPQFPGYLRFQTEGSPVLQAALRGTTNPTAALDRLDALYRSIRPSPASA